MSSPGMASPDARHSRNRRASSEDTLDLDDLMFGFDAGGVVPDRRGPPERPKESEQRVARRWWFWGGERANGESSSQVLSV